MVDITAVAVDHDALHELCLVGVGADDDDDGAPPQYWFVLVPLDRSATAPDIACSTDPYNVLYNTDLYVPLAVGPDEGRARAHLFGMDASSCPPAASDVVHTALMFRLLCGVTM